MSKRIRVTGDSPFNVRDERGSKQSCLVRAAELLGFGGIVAATAVSAVAGRARRGRRAAVVVASVALLAAGCNETVPPSGPPEPATAPRPPGEVLDAMFTAWRADVDSVPYPEWKVA